MDITPYRVVQGVGRIQQQSLSGPTKKASPPRARPKSFPQLPGPCTHSGRWSSHRQRHATTSPEQSDDRPGSHLPPPRLNKKRHLCVEPRPSFISIRAIPLIQREKKDNEGDTKKKQGERIPQCDSRVSPFEHPPPWAWTFRGSEPRWGGRPRRLAIAWTGRSQACGYLVQSTPYRRCPIF